jgi:hypothetical protein
LAFCGNQLSCQIAAQNGSGAENIKHFQSTAPQCWYWLANFSLWSIILSVRRGFFAIFLELISSLFTQVSWMVLMAMFSNPGTLTFSCLAEKVGDLVYSFLMSSTRAGVIFKFEVPVPGSLFLLATGESGLDFANARKGKIVKSSS